MKYHPFSEVFPLLDGAALADLTEDIKTHGLREPIVTYRGAILDGRNRFLACQKANIKPTFTIYTGSEDGALAWVISANVHRRHLNESQRAMAAAKIANLRPGSNQHLPKNTGSSDKVGPIGPTSPVSIEAAATMVNASPKSTKRARKVIEKGSKGLQKAVDTGQVPVSRAAKVVDLPKSEQLAAAQAKPEKPSTCDAEDDGSTPDANEEERITAMEREYAASIEKVMGADDKLAAAHAEIKRQAAEIAALKLSRDGFMNGKAAVTKLLQKEQAKTAKLERQVRELEKQTKGKAA